MISKEKMTGTKIADQLNNVVRIISYEKHFDWTMPFKINDHKMSVGSGFFIDTRGHIITCSHCVEDASYVFVEIPSEGNKQYKAVVKGLSPYFDIALLKVQNYKNNGFCELDDGKIDIVPGIETIAVGYPLGQDNIKITRGIISGQQYNFYQTDTPINPGNSGGPLFYKNKVIGINAAGVPSKEADGIGYSVPIRRFHLIKRFLFNNTKSTKLLLYPSSFGFQYSLTTENTKNFLDHNCKSGGVFITNIIKNTPVSNSGLKKHDILCTINNIEIDSYGNLKKKWMNENMSFENFVSEIGIDKTVKIKFWRKKTLKEGSFKLKIFNPIIRSYYPMFEKIDFECIGGLVVMNLNLNIIFSLNSDNLYEYIQEKHCMVEKLVVVNVLVGGKLKEDNILQKGDIIKFVNDIPVKNVNTFRKAFKNHKNKRYITFKTENEKLNVITRDALKQDDLKIRNLYKYNESVLLKYI